MNVIGRRHWCLALGTALAIHAGVALAMTWPDPPRSGAQMPGLAGLEVSLGAAGGSPGAIEPVAAPAAATLPVEPVQELVAREDATPVEAVVAADIPVETVEAEPVETVEPTAAVEPVEIVEAIEEPQVETVVAEAVAAEPTEPAPVPANKPEVPQAVPTQPVSPAETMAAVADLEVAGETVEGPSESEPAAAAGSAAPGAGVDTGASAGDDTAGGGTPGAVADYYALLQAWLEQHRRYPQRARERKQEGVAYVFFVLDMQGHVLERRLERSSGFPLLDEEVLAMVARADPMPPIPGDMGRSSLSIVVPVAFTLR